jgi:hypothetical protein
MPSEGTVFYSVSPVDGQLREVDPETGETLSSTPMMVAGLPVLGGFGLATHPTTGELFGLLAIDGSGQHELARIDPLSGNAVGVGNTGDAFAGIAFGPDGVLFAVTDDSAVVPASLFVLDAADATPDFVCTLGSGDDGEALASNTGDGTLFHASGFDDRVLETVDDLNVDPCATSDIPLDSVLLPSKVRALTFSNTDGVLFWAQASAGTRELYRVGDDGSAFFVGPMDHRPGGIAFAPRPGVPGDPPAIGHLDCYDARLPRGDGRMTGRLVLVEGRMGGHLMRMGRPYRLCEPVDTTVVDPVSGEIDTPAGGVAMTCYKLKPFRGAEFPKRRISVSNALDRVLELVVRKPRSLCIPSEMETSP